MNSPAPEEAGMNPPDLPTAPPPPPSTFGGNRMARTVGLVVLGLVVLCGVCGSCLFMVQLLLPLFTGGKP